MADGITFDVSELNQLAAHLGAVNIDKPVRDLVAKTALDIEATAKQFAPVDTGNLRNSITHAITASGRFGAIAAEIGTGVEYAHAVEFGTSRQAPQAFLGPALDRHTPAFIAAVNQVVADALPARRGGGV